MTDKFKFFKDNEEQDVWIPIPEDVATWVWWDEVTPSNFDDFKWVLDTIECEGIIDFLSNFPENYIVPVHSITGNNIRHEYRNTGQGWGFNIQREHLTIEYYKLVPDNLDNIHL